MAHALTSRLMVAVSTLIESLSIVNAAISALRWNTSYSSTSRIQHRRDFHLLKPGQDLEETVNQLKRLANAPKVSLERSFSAAYRTRA